MEEVAKVANLERALAKPEALCPEMVVSISEKDQVIVGLRPDLAKSKGTWKKATAHVEASIAMHTKKSLSVDQALELKNRDDQITKLRV